VVIRNGLNIVAFSSIPAKPKEEWVDIAAIVRFAPIKDIKTMIYSFYRLKQDVEKVRLHILGGIDDDEYHQECLELIEYLDIKDIIIPGAVNIKSYLEKIDFTILTSISEGQPFALLESMAAGRPVVATDVGCCRELIEGDEGDNFGMAGICVPPMNQSQLAQALVQMCQNDAGREAMGEVAQKRLQTYFEIEHVITNYLKVYEKAVALWQASALN